MNHQEPRRSFKKSNDDRRSSHRQQQDERRWRDDDRAGSSTSASASTSTSTSASASTSSTEGAKEIPGFYYDPETKKYFKITRDKLVNPYAKQEFKKSKKPRVDLRDRELSKEREQKKRKTIDVSIVHKLKNQSIGVHRRPDLFTRTAKHSLYLDWKPTCVTKTPFKIQNLALDSTASNVLMRGDWLVRIDALDYDRSKGSLSQKPGATQTLICSDVMSSVCWIEADKPLIGIGVFGGAARPGCVQLLDLQGQLAGRYYLSKGSLWSIGYSKAKSQLILGGSNVVSIADLTATRIIHRISIGSDVFSQALGLQDTMLYLGLRNGGFECIDLREARPRKVYSHPGKRFSAVSSMLLLNDERCIISSTSSGDVTKWDLRSAFPNRYIWSQKVSNSDHLRMALDDSQTTLFTGGRDITAQDEGLIQVWDISRACDMKLLRNLSFPGQENEKQVMGLCYSKNWNITGGLSGGGVQWIYDGLTRLDTSNMSGPRMESPGVIVATSNTLWYLSNTNNNQKDDEGGLY